MFVNEWILISTIFILICVSYLSGIYFGRKNVLTKGEKHLSRVTSIQAGLMGILGVMLAFSFSLSSQRFEQRRMLVIQESVKITTAYFRAGLLPDTLKNEVRNLLSGYLDERINFYQTGNTQEDLQESYRKSQNFQVQIWMKTASLGRTAPNLNTNINILALNEMIEVSGNISSLFQSYVPKFILLLLVFIATCTILTMGYSDGLSDDRNIPFAIILNMVLCSILLLMIDMDRPTTGFLKVDIYGLKELKMEIEKYSHYTK